MPKKKLLQAAAPPETHARVERARGLVLQEVGRVPSTSELIRRLVEEGLDRLEAAAKNAPRRSAGAEGHVTTEPNGAQR